MKSNYVTGYKLTQVLHDMKPVIMVFITFQYINVFVFKVIYSLTNDNVFRAATT